ncbi:hypothetical protein SAMN02746098_04898 [Desulfosporosinus lacus DSM 15449]|uniref:Uncharacterized protein n=1 Tax=Desulfosporosinus lacus DSM 15449 TaxID=1121420 RepID=A0A1M6FA15_9FIRM|nr:hypothetical protein SAMN02746098_04898 [Desulfosporosinus lacus DSM 15449]
MSRKSNALRVFVDSNILISAVLSESSIANKLLTLLLLSYAPCPGFNDDKIRAKP